MRYIMRNSITGFLLSLMVAYFIRLWALDRGHKLLSTLATIYMFVLLFPVAIAIAVAALVLLFIFFAKPFRFKNRSWTR